MLIVTILFHHLNANAILVFNRVGFCRQVDCLKTLTFDKTSTSVDDIEGSGIGATNAIGTCDPINECLDATLNTCLDNQICVDLWGHQTAAMVQTNDPTEVVYPGFRCFCKPPFRDDPNNPNQCIEPNECDENACPLR